MRGVDHVAASALYVMRKDFEIMVVWIHHVQMHVAELGCRREKIWFPAGRFFLLLKFYVIGLRLN